ncbi:DUF6485 family protein [Desulfovibrio gilichinskyi]|uniref:DUF6485 family protein n=1 Tax=Desulfovibrio gilichinskyi TaxID=1519643 RepID=UPI000A160977|nr:DUF6485 family protein [Desulfovibrio gilichinskyi]
MSFDKCNNQEKKDFECPCTYAGCPRHGRCCDCVHYHRKKDQLPACYFTAEQEKTYNRSIDFFIECRDK